MLKASKTLALYFLISSLTCIYWKCLIHHSFSTFLTVFFTSKKDANLFSQLSDIEKTDN